MNKHIYRIFCRECDYHNKPKAPDNTDVPALCGEIFNTGSEEEIVIELDDITCFRCWEIAIDGQCPTMEACTAKWIEKNAKT